MCDQCTTGSISFGEVAPGYALHLVSSGTWGSEPESWWGIVHCNDPDFTFPGLQLFSSSRNRRERVDEVYEIITQIERVEGAMFQTIHEFLESCKLEGWDSRNPRRSFPTWLASKLWKMVNTTPNRFLQHLFNTQLRGEVSDHISCSGNVTFDDIRERKMQVLHHLFLNYSSQDNPPHGNAPHSRLRRVFPGLWGLPLDP